MMMIIIYIYQIISDNIKQGTEWPVVCIMSCWEIFRPLLW